jgi:ribonuclease HI
MNASAPHYLLFSDSRDAAEPSRWRFVLRSSDGSRHLVAEDIEPGTQGERLELLTVVRGLEALDQPSRVTLMTSSAYVREGIRYGLAEWRRSGWRWEAFGQLIPVKNSDLWQRLEHALRFHQVECRHWRVDRPHRLAPPSVASAPSAEAPDATRASRTAARACDGPTPGSLDPARPVRHAERGESAGSGALRLLANRCKRWLVWSLARRGWLDMCRSGPGGAASV